MTKYYLYTPGDSSVGIWGYDDIVHENDLEVIWREILDYPRDKEFSLDIAIKELTAFAKDEQGCFERYRECSRHKVHIHPKFGCDVCSDEHMGITEPIKMRRGKFDDED